MNFLRVSQISYDAINNFRSLVIKWYAIMTAVARTFLDLGIKVDCGSICSCVDCERDKH